MLFFPAKIISFVQAQKMQFAEGLLIFNYKRDIKYRVDDEYIYPIPFSLTLPPGIIKYFYVNSEEFIFYYKSDQLIYVGIDLRESLKKKQVQSNHQKFRLIVFFGYLIQKLARFMTFK